MVARGERRRAGRALGLDVDVDAGPLGRGLERLGGHVGVRDAGRAGGDRDQAAAAGGRSRAAAGAGVGRGGGVAAAAAAGCGAGAGRGADDVVHQLDDLVRRLGGAQRVGELRLDQRPGQLGEQLEVGGVAAGGGGDQEHQVGRAVLGAEVDLRREPGEGQRRLLDPRGAAVRDRDAAGQAGRGRRLAGEGVLDELVDVVGAAGVGDDRGERADHVVLVGAEGGVEAHQVGVDEVGHGHPPWGEVEVGAP